MYREIIMNSYDSRNYGSRSRRAEDSRRSVDRFTGAGPLLFGIAPGSPLASFSGMLSAMDFQAAVRCAHGEHDVGAVITIEGELA